MSKIKAAEPLAARWPVERMIRESEIEAGRAMARVNHAQPIEFYVVVRDGFMVLNPSGMDQLYLSHSDLASLWVSIGQSKILLSGSATVVGSFKARFFKTIACSLTAGGSICLYIVVPFPLPAIDYF